MTPALRMDEDVRRAALRRRQALERFVCSQVVPGDTRPIVAGSWVRSAAAGVGHDGNRLPPVRMPRLELDDYRARHPLAPLVPVLGELLGESARDGEHLFAITDASGMLLWVRGHSKALAAAELMNFVEGAVWSEGLAGTNAPGTALATGQPVQIFATEHYSTAVHRWSCAAAPIRDPADGQVLGVLDLTGGSGIASPPVLALVRATARLAEAALAEQMASAQGKHASIDVVGDNGEVAVRFGHAGEPTARLTALGRDSAALEIDGRMLRLTPRHSEIAVALALAPEGISGERLAVQLSEHELHRSTIRAELPGCAPYSVLSYSARPYDEAAGW